MRPVARRWLGVVDKMCPISGILGLELGFWLQEGACRRVIQTDYPYHHDLDHVEARTPASEGGRLPPLWGPARPTTWENTLPLRVKAGLGPEAQGHPSQLGPTWQQSEYDDQSLSTFSLLLKHFPQNPRATRAPFPVGNIDIV